MRRGSNHLRRSSRAREGGSSILETGVAMAKLESVRYYGGFPMSAHHVIAGVKAKLEKAA